MKIFCYGPQIEAALANLASCGLAIVGPINECKTRGGLTPVHGCAQLRGERGGVFVSVENHPVQIPDSILCQAERCGMIWVGLSDEWMRDASWFKAAA